MSALFPSSLAALAFVAVTGPVAAATFTPPAGCELDMTVQSRGCTVIQIYHCVGEPAGYQHGLSMDRQGPYYDAVIDAETRWIESTDLTNNVSETLDPDSNDHASFSTLLRTGHDDFDFWTVVEGEGRYRHIGQDRLTGEVVDIDGMKLEMTEYNLATFSADGVLLVESTGQQFISRQDRRFFGGIETTHYPDETVESNDTPVTFSLPGEKGFGETMPLFDCDVHMVKAPAPTPIVPASVTR